MSDSEPQKPNPESDHHNAALQHLLGLNPRDPYLTVLPEFLEQLPDIKENNDLRKVLTFQISKREERIDLIDQMYEMDRSSLMKIGTKEFEGQPKIYKYLRDRLGELDLLIGYAFVPLKRDVFGRTQDEFPNTSLEGAITVGNRDPYIDILPRLLNLLNLLPPHEANNALREQKEKEVQKRKERQEKIDKLEEAHGLIDHGLGAQDTHGFAAEKYADLAKDIHKLDGEIGDYLGRGETGLPRPIRTVSPQNNQIIP